jgi:hypothetical protein
MPHRRREAGGRSGGLGQQDGIGQAGLDPCGNVHAFSPGPASEQRHRDAEATNRQPDMSEPSVSYY